MSVWGVARVKDEADVIRGVLEHMSDEVDGILVADNNSTDGTRDILDELEGSLPQLVVVDDPEVAYYQSRQMSALAERAAVEYGAEWIIPFDADELWYQPVDRIRTVLPTLAHPVALAVLYNHVRTGDDVDDLDPFRSMVWRLDQPGALGKVAFRWQSGAVIHMGNHGVTLPSGETGGLAVLEIRHYPVRSADQYIHKARIGSAAYAAAPELDEGFGAHWRSWGRMSDDQLRDAFAEHWHYNSPADVGRVRGDGSGLSRDPAPYQRWRGRTG